MLETIRQYAREKLQASGEAGRVQDRHLDFFMQLAEQAETGLRGPEEVVWLDRLEAEHDNLRAALERSIANAAESGLRLAGMLYWFWTVRTYWSEGRMWLARLLALPGAASRTTVRAKALNAAGFLAWNQLDSAAAHALHLESLAIHEELGHRPGVAEALSGLGRAARVQFEYSAARRFFDESLAIRRELGDRHGIAGTLWSLGGVFYKQGDLATARPLFQESLAMWRDLGDRSGIAWTLHYLGRVSELQGDYTQAAVLYRESHDLFQELGDKFGLVSTLQDLGHVALNQGDFIQASTYVTESLALARELGFKRYAALSLNTLGEIARLRTDYKRAATLYDESLALRRESGDKPGVMRTLCNLGHVALHEQQYPKASTYFKESLVLAEGIGPITLDSGLVTVVCLTGFAGLAAATGLPERAARLFGAAEALMEKIQRVWPPADCAEYDHNVAATRAQLDEAAFAAAWADGRAMPVEQAMAYALETQPPA